MRMTKLNRHFRRFAILSSFLGTLFLNSQYVAAAAAGKVVFATGSARAVNDAGDSRVLRRGSEIFSGDSLQTAARSRLQVSLADGAYVSVQPASEYKIEDYNYSGKEDGTERAFYRLLKGGIRAVTGYIGKRNRDAYKVNTAVATIGIRGTGHNTRICAGDCPGKKDGLYHSTWEGLTTVENEKDKADVPAGNGVYVEDSESDIESTSQPDSATALDTTKKKQEEEQEEEDANELARTGEQRSGEDGLQNIVVDDDEVQRVIGSPVGPPTFSETFGGLSVIAVGPEADPNALEGEASALFDTTVFKNSSGQPIAFFGFEEDDDDVQGVFQKFQTFATIDPAAALGATDESLTDLIRIFLQFATQSELDNFLTNPASVGEFSTTSGGLSLGRWENGNVLSIIKNFDTDQFDEVGVDVLTGFQSIHFIYGEAPGAIPASGSAIYQFADGTASTSNSGATIGNGVLSGAIAVNFANADASITMNVDHNNSLYSVFGNLQLDNEFLFDMNTVFASTSTSGSACNPICNTIIDGGFAGPNFGSSPDVPKNIGIEYEILETDIITGVAGFTTPTGLLTPQQQLLMDTLVGVSAPGTLPNINQLADVVLTGDPVTVVDSVLRSDFSGSIFPDVLTIITAQSFETYNDGTLFITRWSNGDVEDVFNNTTPNTFSLNADQGVHFALGIPNSSFPSSSPGGTATYNFIPGSETLTTHLSGSDTADGGINGGSIQLNFFTAEAFPNFTLIHDAELFTVTGPSSGSIGIPFASPLAGSTTTQTGFFGAAEATSSIICSSTCTADIGAVFAGDASSSIGNVPAELGVVYRIVTGDPFTGAGGFTLSSASP
ncbi:MAG: hypothetical protein GKR93_01840 [Gammaproteobacteria bacterium]|nr:hypothetical protein [Gammaproteobacteria bacterium]